MYDLVSHLIYLDNFSEMKTSKTSLGKEIPIPAPTPNHHHHQVSRLFLGLPGSALGRGGVGDTTTTPHNPGAHPWERGACS